MRKLTVGGWRVVRRVCFVAAVVAALAGGWANLGRSEQGRRVEGLVRGFLGRLVRQGKGVWAAVKI